MKEKVANIENEVSLVQFPKAYTTSFVKPTSNTMVTKKGILQVPNGELKLMNSSFLLTFPDCSLEYKQQESKSFPICSHCCITSA